MKTSTERTRRWIAIVTVAMLCLLVAYLFFQFGRPMVELVSNPERFHIWINEKGWAARWIYIGMVAFQVIVAIIPGEPLELAAGYAFGALEGTILCLVGIGLGSIAVFSLVRLLGRRAVSLFFSEEKIDSLKIMKNPKRLYWITAILMILPGTPKDLLTWCAGLTKIPFGAWILISTFGRIPSVITSTLCAHALSEGRYAFAAIVFVATMLLCLAGLYLYSKINGHEEKKKIQ